MVVWFGATARGDGIDSVLVSELPILEAWYSCLPMCTVYGRSALLLHRCIVPHVVLADLQYLLFGVRVV